MKRKTLAIPVRLVDYSDSSQVVSFFTRDHGLLEGIAKGAHREKNAFQGPFDLAVLYEVVFIERRSAGLAIITEGAVLDGLRGLRRRWDGFAGSCHLLEFLRAVAMPGDAAPELFDLSLETLRLLAGAEAGRPEGPLARFDVRALGLLGLLPPVDACVACGREWPGGGRAVHFSVRAGGILCRACRSGDAAAEGTTLPAAAVELLRRLARDDGEDAPWGDDVAAAWEAIGPPVARVIAGLRTRLLERDLCLLKSLRALA
jgi:DNA repair protein RecO (recombination protein O)